jgi:SAP domain-containing protein
MESLSVDKYESFLKYIVCAFCSQTRLKAICRASNLKVSGTKAVLIQRISDNDRLVVEQNEAQGVFNTHCTFCGAIRYQQNIYSNDCPRCSFAGEGQWDHGGIGYDILGNPCVPRFGVDGRRL